MIRNWRNWNAPRTWEEFVKDLTWLGGLFIAMNAAALIGALFLLIPLIGIIIFFIAFVACVILQLWFTVLLVLAIIKYAPTAIRAIGSSLKK